jgi:phage tail protein X
MAIALQEAPASGQSTTQNPSQAFVANVAAGDLLIFDLSWGVVTGSVSQVLDTTDSIPWTAIDLLQAQGRSNTLYAKIVRTAGACTVTASTDASRAYAFSLYRFSGVTINLDGTIKHNSGGATTNPFTSSLTTAFAVDLVIAALRGGNVSVSPSSPWVSEATGGHGTTYEIRSATGTVSTSWTTTSAAFVDTLLAFRGGSTINLTGLASAEADGSPKVSTAITLSGLASTEGDGTPSVYPGIASIILAGQGSTELDGTPSVFPGAASINLAGHSSDELDGTPSITVGAVAVTLSGLGSQEADGTPSVTPGAVNISLTGYPSQELDGTPSIVPGAISLELIGIASSEVDGTPNVTLTPFPIGLIGLASGESDGSPTVVPGALSIALAGIGSSESDGTPAISLGPATIVLTGLGSIELDGTPSVTQSGFIYLSGLPSTESDGVPEVSIEPQRLVPFTPNVVNGHLIAKTIQSQGGDFWDSISKREYKTEKLFNVLAAANPMLASYAELPAGLTINVPFIEVTPPSISTLPWSKLVQYA